MSEEFSKLSAEYQRKWRALGDFLDPKNRELDDDERAALNPILHALRRETEHYEFIEEIAVGGEKQIHRVRDRMTNRIVAMARPLARATDEEKERFLREARITAGLQHPNIVSIYDLGLDEEGIPFFVMEFIQGDTLQDIVIRLAAGDADYTARYPRVRLIQIITKIGDALSYAHAKGVAHLDLKPANIKVGPFGEVHLCDWGLARIFTAGFDRTDADIGLEDDLPNSDLLNDLVPRGYLLGTLGFLAPEQAQGDTPGSSQTDVYSLGALLYFVLTFQTPIESADDEHMRQHTLQGRIKPLAQSASVAPGLQAVLRRALALQPADRYATTTEFNAELERHLLGFPTSAQKANVLVRLEHLYRRRPALFFVSGLSLGLLALALGVSSVRIDQARREAVASRDAAEANLRLYLREQDRAESLGANILSAADDLENPQNYLDAAGKTRLLEFQLQQPDLTPAQRADIAERIAILSFVRFKFDEAVTSFERSGSDLSENPFYSIALKYRDEMHEDPAWPQPDVLRDIVITLPNRYDTVNFAMAFYYFQMPQSREDPDALLPLIEVLLDRLNHKGRLSERTPELRLEHTPQGLALDLSHQNYGIFNLPLPVIKRHSNVLYPLGLHSLSFSHGVLTDMIQLQGSDIKELDITGLPNFPDAQLRWLRVLQLERIIHSLSQTDEELQQILPDVEFVRVPKP
ncbi:MAG: hypothetical protein SynsKO_27310 [Synoicihabitans sp.]